ncbi:MAG TPA: hypothetical protein VFR02_00220 [bacterium]|nr:hypothetical protein [bacterium]
MTVFNFAGKGPVVLSDPMVLLRLLGAACLLVGTVFLWKPDILKNWWVDKQSLMRSIASPAVNRFLYRLSGSILVVMGLFCLLADQDTVANVVGNIARFLFGDR